MSAPRPSTLGVSTTVATSLLAIGLALYGPWAWANAWWIKRVPLPPA